MLIGDEMKKNKLKKGRRSTNTDKIYIRLPGKKIDLIKKEAEQLGLTYTMFGGLLLWKGFTSFMSENKQLKLDIDQ